MENKKLFGRVCPSCGEIYKTRTVADVTLGGGAQVNMQCEHGHKWSEFYSLSYQGYWWYGKRYDTYGDEIKKNE